VTEVVVIIMILILPEEKRRDSPARKHDAGILNVVIFIAKDMINLKEKG
jgi:hypothetical protein